MIQQLEEQILTFRLSQGANDLPSIIWFPVKHHLLYSFNDVIKTKMLGKSHLQVSKLLMLNLTQGTQNYIVLVFQMCIFNVQTERVKGTQE